MVKNRRGDKLNWANLLFGLFLFNPRKPHACLITPLSIKLLLVLLTYLEKHAI